jgi:uncharacterized protein YndB with AHSA1/START domain
MDMPEAAATQSSQEFILNRHIPAKQERVFSAFTQAEQLRQWWGPKGFHSTHCTLDLRRGGVMHYCLDGQGAPVWGKWVIVELLPPRRLGFIACFSDADAGEPTRHPQLADWPRETMTEIEFRAQADGALLRVVSTPLNATPAERRCFARHHDALDQGWSDTLDKLSEHLARSA